jgi:uncharacterized protein (TIGR02466 family)|tara:strand:- start:344 stop:922 length:579 start_codon:yes stop_codon:yes gene_type:complete
MSMHTELWFPSVIWSAIIHVVDNAKLKTYAYDRKRTDRGRTVSNFGGWQSTDILAGENDQIDRLVQQLNQETKNCCLQVGLPRLEIKNIWLNINPPASYNQLHNHAGSVLSGVYYVDASPGQGNILFDRNDGAEYFMPELVEKNTYFTSTRATYNCKTNGLYIFPSWMKHSVEGNQSNTDRISVSFNYGERK